MDAISTAIEALSTDDAGLDLDLLLWVDAICINQLDDTEKSWQVAQMADLYSNAEQTLIFLGLQTERSDEAADLFESIATEAEGYNIQSDCDGLDTRIQSVITMLTKENPMVTQLQGLDAFIATTVRKWNTDLLMLTTAIMASSWWGRTWVRIIQLNVF